MLLSLTPSINRIPGKKSTIFLPYEGGAPNPGHKKTRVDIITDENEAIAHTQKQIAANPSHKKTQVDIKDPIKVIAAKPPSRQKTLVPHDAIVHREKQITAKKTAQNGDDAITVATKKSTTFLPYEGGAPKPGHKETRVDIAHTQKQISTNPSHKETQVDIKDPNKVIAAKPPSRQKTLVPHDAIAQREKQIIAKKTAQNGDATKKSTTFLPYEGGAPKPGHKETRVDIAHTQKQISTNPSHKETQVDIKDPNKVIAAKPPSRQKTLVPHDAIAQREKQIIAKKTAQNGDATKKSTTFLPYEGGAPKPGHKETRVETRVNIKNPHDGIAYREKQIAAEKARKKRNREREEKCERDWIKWTKYQKHMEELQRMDDEEAAQWRKKQQDDDIRNTQQMYPSHKSEFSRLYKDPRLTDEEYLQHFPRSEWESLPFYHPNIDSNEKHTNKT